MKAEIVDLTLPRNGFREFISSWILEHDGLVYVIDCGPANSLPLLYEALGSRVPDYILLTHIHVDHAGGIGQFSAHFPNAKIFASELARPHLVNPEKLIQGSIKTLGESMMNLYGPILPVKESLLLQEAPPAVSVILTPGHAAHHISFHIDDMLFCGEALGVCHRTPSDQGRYIRPATPIRFDLQAYTSSIERLKFFEQGTLCFAHFGSIPAHPDIYKTALHQIDFWLDEIAGFMKNAEALRVEQEDEILDTLVLRDPLIHEFSNFAPDIQERERTFMKNSIRGIWDYLLRN